MNYLLDTCVFIWAMTDSKNLSKQLRNIIINTSNNIYISVATPWEIIIKKSLGKLTCPDNIEELIEINDFKKLEINFKHVLNLQELEKHHKDPFDRILISQAKTEKLTILTDDKKFKDYNVKIIGN
jgi:PIN domain nuclease of toxin-antitoxin system